MKFPAAPSFSFWGIRTKLTWVWVIFITLISMLLLASSNPLVSIASILGLFASVVLHEYGHAITAKRLGYQIHEILLTPIGGVALLKQEMRKPTDEALITAAGPMVNFAIAAVLYPFLQYELASKLFVSNVVLAGFNLLPFFPMDGGRMIRSLFAAITGYDMARRITRWTSLGAAALLMPWIYMQFDVVACLLIGTIVLLSFLNEGRVAELTKSQGSIKTQLDRSRKRVLSMMSEDEQKTLSEKGILGQTVNAFAGIRSLKLDVVILEREDRLPSGSNDALSRSILENTLDEGIREQFNRDYLACEGNYLRRLEVVERFIKEEILCRSSEVTETRTEDTLLTS